MQNIKSVTAILPNYNYSSFIEKRVNEILNQTYQVAEIIILDDGSTDDSQQKIARIAADLKRSNRPIIVKTSINQKNSGNVFSQWQKGIRISTSDYVWICELDDSSSLNFLENVMAGFASSNVVLSYSNSRIIDEAGHTPIKESLRQIKDLARRHHKPGKYIVDGEVEVDKNLAVFNSIPNVSATVFKNLPKLDTFLEKAKQFRLSGDWFFYLQLATCGKIAYCNKKLNFHRVHKNSVTGRTDLNERLREMQQIHQYVNKTFNLSAATQSRIISLERQLIRKWQ